MGRRYRSKWSARKRRGHAQALGAIRSWFKANHARFSTDEVNEVKAGLFRSSRLENASRVLPILVKSCLLNGNLFAEVSGIRYMVDHTRDKAIRLMTVAERRIVFVAFRTRARAEVPDKWAALERKMAQITLDAEGLSIRWTCEVVRAVRPERSF